MSEEQKRQFVFWFVAGFGIKDCSRFCNSKLKNVRNFRRRKEFKSFLKDELNNVYGNEKYYPENMKKILKG